MLDDYKRNVLPGAAYSNITFLLTTIRGKNYISHLKRTTIRVLTSHVASPPPFSVSLCLLGQAKERNLKVHCALCCELLFLL